MSDHERADPTVLEGVDERVLLSIAGERDRQLLAGRLGDRYRVVDGDPGEVDAFDLCIVDAPTYRRIESSLAELKRGTETYLPVLLLVEDRERAREAEWIAETVGGTVDDVLVIPTPKHELDARVEAMLRARRQSRRLALYRRAMDEASIGISITDPDRPDNPLVYVNDGFCRLTGYDREDVLGENCRFLQGPDTEEATVDRLRNAIESEEPVTVELLNYRADGEPFWNRLTVAPVRDDDGDVTHYLGFQEDVTGEVERKRELERDARVLETMEDGVWTVDEDRRVAFVNASVVDGLPLEADDIVGTPIAQFEYLFEDPAGFERYRAAIDDLLEGRAESAEFDARLALPEGRADTSFRLAPIDGEDGPTGVVVVANDITERVERERELERYETIVETTTDPIYVLDPDGRFVRVNDAMVEASGYDREELVGSHASMVADEEMVARAEAIIRDLVADGREHATFEGSMEFADGTTREYSVSLSILREDGEFEGTVVAAHDVTDLRDHQRRLSVLDRVLRHNLRNRMNVVLGYAQELAGHDDPDVAHLGGAIEDSAAELLDLSESAREFESVISGTAEATTTMDVVALVETAVADARSEHPGADISVDCPEAAHARAHETFELAVEELLENAISHCDREAPTVEVSVTVADDDVLIRVADEGPGLDDVDRRALQSGSESPLEHTQGLGLWLVKWTVESAGGELDIEPREPRGTVVTLSLPRAPP